MKSNEPKNNCPTKRTAAVVRFAHDYAEIECKGKLILIPRHKLASAVSVGDRIEWTGREWTKPANQELK